MSLLNILSQSEYVYFLKNETQSSTSFDDERGGREFFVYKGIFLGAKRNFGKHMDATLNFITIDKYKLIRSEIDA